MHAESSPLLTVHLCECMAMRNSNIIIKFMDNTTVIGLISNNDEEAYRKEVRNLALWCQENNLSLKIDKTNALIMDYRKQAGSHIHTHTHIQA